MYTLYYQFYHTQLVTLLLLRLDGKLDAPSYHGNSFGTFTLELAGFTYDTPDFTRLEMEEIEVLQVVKDGWILAWDKPDRELVRLSFGNTVLAYLLVDKRGTDIEVIAGHKVLRVQEGQLVHPF